MKAKSRREFIKSCLYLACSGLGVALFPQFGDPHPLLPVYPAGGQSGSRQGPAAPPGLQYLRTGTPEILKTLDGVIPASDGHMYRGLTIRHLVMPNRVGGTKEVIQWIAKHLPKDTYLNLMSQYRPMHKAFEYPEISRRITRKEYAEAIRWAQEAGLRNLDIRGYPCSKSHHIHIHIYIISSAILDGSYKR